MLYPRLSAKILFASFILKVTFLIAPLAGASADSQSRPASLSTQNSPSKSQILKRLYYKLQHAEDSKNANTIEKEIEGVWLESGSHTVNLLMQRALRSQSENKNTVCLHLLNEIVTIAPGYQTGWYRRALIHFNNGNYSLALIDIRQVLALDPHNFKAIYGLGLILQEVGNKKSALRVFKKLLAIHPHYEDAKKAVEQLTIEVEGQDT
ncbi:MAG: tetratricopeptide repeat protein [Methyloligellaceae bacterium]